MSPAPLALNREPLYFPLCMARPLLVIQNIIELDRLRSFLLERGQTALYALVIFLFALLIAVVVSRVSKKWLTALLDRSRVGEDLLLKHFFLRTLTLSIYIMALLTALGSVGLDVRTFIAGLGITGLIIGFGLRDILSNFAAGLLLLIYRPFRAGQMIEVEGAQGVVEELTIVNMQMTTNDGVRVIMPNSKVWGAKIINYSLSERRRLELHLRVAAESIEDAIRTIISALESDPRILPDPSPSVRVSSLSNNSAKLLVWGWSLPKDYQAVNADLYIKLLNALREAKIQAL